MNPDIINASFELLGSYFIWKSVLELYKAKQLVGVYLPMFLFFATWGSWNLYYYPSLGQYFSFAAGIVMVLGNIVFAVLATKYSKINERLS